MAETPDHDPTEPPQAAQAYPEQTEPGQAAQADPDATEPEQPEPTELSADYENTAAREAMLALQAQPDYEHLAAFLLSLREGLLFADVTGGHKKKSTRVRTIRSTKGQLLLPLFTSMHELRTAHPKSRQSEVKGAMTPAHEALGLMRTSPFVAVQFDAGSAALVVLRKYIDLVQSDQPIDAATLEALA